MRLSALLSESVSHAGRLAPLALIPLFTSLARWHDVVTLAKRPGQHFNVRFGFPHPLADLWTFVDAPSPVDRIGGVGRGTPVVDLPVVVEAGLIVSAVAAAVFLIGAGLLMAGYVGSIDQYVDEGRFDFVDNVLAYGLRMVGFQFAVLAAGVAMIFAVVAVPVLFVIGVLAMFALAFLFFLVPYLVVVADLPLVEAFRRSPELATGRSEPLAFFVGYAALVAVGSLPLSAVVNAGFPGVLLAAVVSSAAGLVLTTFSVLFVRELLGRTTRGQRPPAG